jgi:hypothetical protein
VNEDTGLKGGEKTEVHMKINNGEEQNIQGCDAVYSVEVVGILPPSGTLKTRYAGNQQAELSRRRLYIPPKRR